MVWSGNAGIESMSLSRTPPGPDPGIWSVPCKLCLLLFLLPIQLLYLSHIDP